MVTGKIAARADHHECPVSGNLGEPHLKLLFRVNRKTVFA